MNVVAGTQALAPNLTTYFLGQGGTPPYSYAVLGGGAGGTINPVSGLYVAPSVTGQDTIRVTDSLLAFADLPILIGLPLELFCDVIQKELGLTADQVYLWDQKLNIPTDSRLYVAVSMLNCKPFGNRNKLLGSGDAEQSVNMMATLGVDILSRGPEARDRKEEIILALNSTYAQQQQELNSFYIGKLSTGFVNLSQEDGAAIPYRYNISVNVQYFIGKTKPVSYYNTFETVEVTTEP